MTMSFRTPASFIPLPNATEDADTLLVSDHVVNCLGKQYRLADPSATEQPCFTAALQWHKNIDGLDPSLEDFRLRGSFGQRRGSAMHSAPFNICGSRLFIDRITKDVEHARKDVLADRHSELRSAIFRLHASSEFLRCGQSNASHTMRVELFHNLDDDLFAGSRMKHGVDGRQIPFKPDVDHRSPDGHDRSVIHFA
jgi:hypothetical protein